jgi:hypothetical protein
MADQINYNVNINTKDAVQSVDNLNSSLQGVESTASKTSGIGEKLAGIKGPVGQAVQAVQGFGKSLLVLAANPVVLTITAITAALGLLYKAFTSTDEGGEKVDQLMAGLNAVMNVFRDVLVKVANILIGIFQDPQKALSDFAGMLKENIINRFEGLLELLPQLGKAIGLLFSGEFSEAGKVATNAVAKVALGVEDMTGKLDAAGKAIGKVMDEAQREAAIAANIERQFAKIADAERALGVQRAKQNKELAAARLMMEDENATLDERINALQQVGKAEDELLTKEMGIAKQKLALINQRNALSDISDEMAQEAADAQSKVYELEAQSILRKRKLTKSIDSLNKEDAAKKKQELKDIEDAAKLAADAEKTRLDELQKAKEESINKTSDQQKINAYNTIQNEKDLAEALAQIELERTNQLIASRTAAGLAVTDLELKNAQYLADKKFQIEKEAAENTKKLEEAKKANALAIIEATGKALGTFSQLVGENTATGKALAVASAIIDTYMGANKALAAGAATPPLGYINAAAIIATGLMNVKKIVSTPIPGQSASGAMPSMGPSVSIIGGTADPSAQMAASLNKNLNKPAKAYVVGNDMSSQQALDRRIQTNATFPG